MPAVCEKKIEDDKRAEKDQKSNAKGKLAKQRTHGNEKTKAKRERDRNGEENTRAVANGHVQRRGLDNETGKSEEKQREKDEGRRKNAAVADRR